jgi:hypothetical protein
LTPFAPYPPQPPLLAKIKCRAIVDNFPACGKPGIGANLTVGARPVKWRRLISLFFRTTARRRHDGLRWHPCRRFGWPCRKPQASRTPNHDGFVFIQPGKDEGPKAKAVFLGKAKTGNRELEHRPPSKTGSELQ